MKYKAIMASTLSNGLENLNEHLENGWEVDAMQPFGVSSGARIAQNGKMLIILKKQE